MSEHRLPEPRLFENHRPPEHRLIERHLFERHLLDSRPPESCRVAVVFGGLSPEHDVSRRSARSLIEELGKMGHEPVPYHLPLDDCVQPAERREAKGMADFLRGYPRDFDIVFPVIHGPNGEDGTLQGMCELLGIPYVGSDVLGSAICLDKAVCKRMLNAAGLPTAAGVVVRAAEWSDNRGAVERTIASDVGSPAFVKPCGMGSSIGASIAETGAELAGALERAFIYDSKVLVEEFISGRELEVAILGDAPPEGGERVTLGEVGESFTAHAFLDFGAKYVSGGGFRVPARIEEAQKQRLWDCTKRAFHDLELSGLVRVDFFLTGDRLLINEINTIPGLTFRSTAVLLMKEVGISFSDILERLLHLALRRHSRRAQKHARWRRHFHQLA